MVKHLMHFSLHVLPSFPSFCLSSSFLSSWCKVKSNKVCMTRIKKRRSLLARENHGAPGNPSKMNNAMVHSVGLDMEPMTFLPSS